MQIHFDKVVLPDGEFPVHAASENLAVMLVGPVEFYVQGPEDADRLIRAAAKAKQLMEAKALRAEMKPLVISDSTIQQAQFFAQPGNTIDDVLAEQQAAS